ncbi:hypothetical protein [Glutamicibacter soli]
MAQSNKQDIRGDGNFQIAGDYTQNIYPTVKPRLTQSKIHSLLLMICEASAAHGFFRDLDLSLPAKVKEKLNHNKANKYISVFRHQIREFELIQEASQNIPNSEDILTQISRCYANVAEFDDDGTPLIGDGSAQLDQIGPQLEEIIVSDEKFDSTLVTYEEIHNFIEALLMFGVWKCVALVKPETGDVHFDFRG